MACISGSVWYGSNIESSTASTYSYFTNTKLVSWIFIVKRFWNEVLMMYDCIEGLSSFIILSWSIMNAYEQSFLYQSPYQ